MIKDERHFNELFYTLIGLKVNFLSALGSPPCDEILFKFGFSLFSTLNTRARRQYVKRYWFIKKEVRGQGWSSR